MKPVYLLLLAFAGLSIAQPIRDTSGSSGGDVTLTGVQTLTNKVVVSAAAAPAQSGVFRLGNNEFIGWRNNANSATLALRATTTDRLQFESVNIPTISSTDTFTNKTLTNPLLSGNLSTTTANVAASGHIRLATTDYIAWRNGANSADLTMDLVSDRLRFGSVNIPTISSSDTFTNKTISAAAFSGTQTGTFTTSGNIVPTAATQDIGAAAAATVWRYLFAGEVRDATNIYRVAFPAASTNNYRGAIANGASAIAHTFFNSAALTTAGAKIAQFESSATAHSASIDKDGNYINGDLDVGFPGGTGITANREGQHRHFVYKATITNAFWTAAATTQQKTIWTVPAKTRIIRVVMNVTTAFSGGAAATGTISLGLAGTPAGYLLASDVMATGTYGDSSAELGADMTAFGHFPNYASATALTADIITTGANVNAYTAGSAAIEIEAVTY